MTTKPDAKGIGNGSLPKVEELLAELINTQRLQQRLDFGHFLDWAIYNRFAYIDVGSYTITVPGSSSITLSTDNPKGYIWVPHVEVAVVLTSTPFAVTVEDVRDGQVFTSGLVGSVSINTFTWQDMPWVGAGIVKNNRSATWTNTSILSKWLIGGYVGTYLLYTEWQDYIHDLVQQYPRNWRKY